MTTAQLGASGIVVGETDALGCRWRWASGSNDPWSPSPSPRDVMGENATEHGSWDATEFYGPRSFAIEGTVVAPSHEALHRAKARLQGACGLRPFVLRIVEPGYDRYAVVRRGGDLSWSEINPTSPPTARWSVPLWAGDPRVYSTALLTASTGFPATSGGLALPAAVPLALSATQSTGSMSLLNEGNEVAWPVYRIDPAGSAPVVNPVIVDANSGRAMRFALTVNPGEWLTIDTRTHEVLGNGDPAASRRNTFYGDWFGIGPVSSSVVRYSGASGAGSTLSASWHHTDI